MGKPLIRIDRDVFSFLTKSAAKNERTVPKELNRLLRELFAKQAAKEGGK